MRLSFLGKFLLVVGAFLAGIATLGVMLGFAPWFAPFLVGLVIYKFVFVLAVALFIGGAVALYASRKNEVV